MNAVEHAVILFGRHREELGFIMRKSIEQAEARNELFVTSAGAAMVWNRRDTQTTIHAICSEEPGQGSRLLQLIVSDCRARGQTCLVAKCVASLPADRWYARRGFVVLRSEPGKWRPLNVWQFTL